MNCSLKAGLLLLCLATGLFSMGQRNILKNELQKVGLEKLTGNFNPFPGYDDRQAWQDIPQKLSGKIIAEAETYLNYDWAPLPAMLFLEFSQNGNRSNYEKVSFKRREVLSALVLAECLEHKGRYLNNIVNGIWAICEESFWGVPAHIYPERKREAGLPDVTDPYVDLFAAETGSLLSWTYYFLHDQLDKISPLVNKRIVHEINQRILTPTLEHDDFWWMGFNNGQVNNWNPWIASNWLTCALLIEKDTERKKKAINKIIVCLDHFLNDYPEDGGCDEGPSYWDRAGGALFDCLELLYGASGGAYAVFDNQLVKNIGSYLYDVHIDKDYYINFADASARVSINPYLVFNYGKRTGNENLKNLGIYAASEQKTGEGNLNGNLYQLSSILFNAKELLGAEKAILKPHDFWLPSLQVFGAREKPGSVDGFFLAGKGGHNAESHNHNDVGNFILYYDGKPAIIDIGVETYTSKTFSSNRYEIWTMQSAYHNLPTVNGYMQSAGKQYAAKNVQFKESDKEAVFSLDIAGAYPAEAGILKWARKLDLQRSATMRLTDSYALKAVKGDIFLTLMTPCPVTISEGKAILAGNGFEVDIRYDKNKLEAAVEERKVEDSRLKKSWSDKLYRIKLTLKNPRAKDKIELTMKAVRK